MMQTMLRITSLLLLVAAASISTPASTTGGEPQDARQQATQMFAVRFRPGPAWIKEKPPGEQTGFAAHSANLQRLRREGALVLGGRFADVGLIVVRAVDAGAARTLFAADTTIAAQVFTVEIDPWSTVFAGCTDERR